MVRGQVARFIKFHRRKIKFMNSGDVISKKCYSITGVDNLNMKDRVQLAAIIRGNTPWAKKCLE